MNPTPVREASVHWSTWCRFAMTLPTFLLMLLPSPIPDEETGLEIHKISRPPGFSAERRRSRAVLYQLSGHLQKQDKSKSKLKINNVRLVSSFFAPSPLPHSAPTPPTLDSNLLFSLKLGYSFINNFWPRRPCCFPPPPLSLPSTALIIYEIEETVKGIGIVVSLWRPNSGSAILWWNSRWGLLAGNTLTPLVSPTLQKRLEVT